MIDIKRLHELEKEADTLKDFYDTLKTTTMQELHDKYQLVYKAITDAKIEQEYNDIKVNDIITVEKVEKYRSSEYINTTYQLKN